MGTWINDDGLLVKFGRSEAVEGVAGQLPPSSGTHTVELQLADMTAVTSTDTVLDYGTILPAGATIKKVEVFVETAVTSGGAATLNIGLENEDATEQDYDGLVDAMALTAIDAVGETTELTAGDTGAGALVGTTLATNGRLTASYGTAVYTAGKVAVRIEYVM